MASIVNISLISTIYLEHSEASVEVVSKTVSLKRCTVCEVQGTYLGFVCPGWPTRAPARLCAGPWPAAARAHRPSA